MEKMGKNFAAFPRALVLVPPKSISYQTQSVLIPCPPHRIAPLSVFGESDHKSEAKRLVCLKQQGVTRKSNIHQQDANPDLSETYNQEKTLPCKNMESSEKSYQQNYPENNLTLFFRNKIPHTFRDPRCKRRKTKISVTVKSGSTKDQAIDESKTSSRKSTTGPNTSASGAEKASPQVQGKKMTKGTVKSARGSDPCTKDTSSKNKQLVQIPVGSRQIWEGLCHQGKHHLGSSKQPRFEVICPHHTRIHFLPDDQSTYILKRPLKIPSSAPEVEAQKQWENFSHDYKHQIIPVYHQQQAQAALDFVSRTLVPLYQKAIKCEESMSKAIRRQLNKRNWENFFHCHDHHLAIPLCHQNQAQTTVDLISEVSLPRNHLHLKSAGPPCVRKSAKKQSRKRSWPKCPCDCDHHVTIPLCHQHQAQDLVPRMLLPPDHIYTKCEAPFNMNMIFECQRKCQPFTRPLPGPLYSSRPLLIKALPTPDCWSPESVSISERHSKTPFHLSIQDMPTPQKLALLTKAPKCHHYQSKTSRASDYQSGYSYKISPEQIRGRARCLYDIKPYSIKGHTYPTKFVDDITRSIPKKKIESDLYNQVHLRQMRQCPHPTHWPKRYISPNYNTCLFCTSLTSDGHPHVDRMKPSPPVKLVTVPTSLPVPEKMHVRYFHHVPQSEANPSSKPPGILSRKLRPLRLSPVFPSCSHSDPASLAPVKPKVTWLDLIHGKSEQLKEKKSFPSQKPIWKEMPFTSKNTKEETSKRQKICSMSLLDKFESRINS